jgi:hypothetical protein
MSLFLTPATHSSQSDVVGASPPTCERSTAMNKRIARRAAAVGAGIALMLAVAAPASAAAIVERSRGNVTCVADPGDVPGLPGFGFANSTVVIAPGGILNVTCTGSLPEGLSVPETFVGDVVCRGDTPEQDVIGQIIVTKSGQATLRCQFRIDPFAGS